MRPRQSGFGGALELELSPPLRNAKPETVSNQVPGAGSCGFDAVEEQDAWAPKGSSLKRMTACELFSRDSVESDSGLPWRGALLLGLVAGLSGGAVAGFGLVSGFWTMFCVGLCFMTMFCVGLCLPRCTVLSPSVRHCLEFLVLAGWIARVVYTVSLVLTTRLEEHSADGTKATSAADSVNESTRSNGVYIFFFSLLPLSFSILCWNNMDMRVVHVLTKQFHYWLIGVLCVWLVVVRAWGQASTHMNDDGDPHWVYCVSLALVLYGPFSFILVVDSIQQQSTVFRICLPLLYAVTVILTWSVLQRP
jgi:hypothetical protein